MAVERAGIPAVVNVCEGFVSQAHAVYELGGVPWGNVVHYPGHIDTYSVEQRETYISELIVPGNIEALTTPIEGVVGAGVEAPETEVAFEGSWEEVLEFYREKGWSDGLPIIPPTRERIEEFLKYTDYPADAILTRAMPPSYRQATPWWVAVNGVMAGCRPEYMPVLIAMTKAWGETGFDGHTASSTPGWSPISIVSGPLKKQLGLNIKNNYGTPGCVSNTSMGRFWTMFKRNLMEMRLEVPTDMGTHGYNVFTLRGEDDDLCAQLGWKTLAEEQGFEVGDSVLTTMSCHCQSEAAAIIGDTGEDFLSGICGQIAEGACCQWRLTSGWNIFVVTKVVADVLARDGFDKDSMRDYLYKNARRKASYLETRLRSDGVGYLCKQVADGKLPQMFCESEDPDRMVPIFRDPTKIIFVVGGDDSRNRVVVFLNNGGQGALTSVKIELPTNWDALYNESQLKKDLEKSGRDIL